MITSVIIFGCTSGNSLHTCLLHREGRLSYRAAALELGGIFGGNVNGVLEQGDGAQFDLCGVTWRDFRQLSNGLSQVVKVGQ